MSSKPLSFVKGDLIEAEIVEVMADASVICSFDGRLMRVKNSSARSLRAGQKVILKVARTFPLELSLGSPERRPLSRLV